MMLRSSYCLEKKFSDKFFVTNCHVTNVYIMCLRLNFHLVSYFDLELNDLELILGQGLPGRPWPKIIRNDARARRCTWVSVVCHPAKYRYQLRKWDQRIIGNLSLTCRRIELPSSNMSCTHCLCPASHGDNVTISVTSVYRTPDSMNPWGCTV